MKKYIGISMVALVILIIVGCGWIIYDSRDYFKEYFEVERQKLNLRSEASVDSLQNVIIINHKQIDSLNVEIDKYNQLISNGSSGYKQQIDSQNKQIKTLQNVINHQNQMIDDLRKK